MSPYMRPDLAPDPARERCGNCGVPFEEHPVCHGCECDDKECEKRHLSTDGRCRLPPRERRGPHRRLGGSTRAMKWFTRTCSCRCRCRREIYDGEGFLCGICALEAWKGNPQHENRIEAHR